MKQPLLLTLPFIIVSCAQALQEHPQPKPQPTPSGVTINDASRPKLGLDELQPAEVVQAVEATFRLTPDRRFLAAIADVYELSTGRTAASVDIDFRDGAWRVRCGGSDVGTLPDLPTFEDQMALLTKWSAALAANAPAAKPLPSDVAAAVDRDIEAFDPPHLFSAIDRLSKQPSLDADGWARAAHAATLLTAQIFDQFDFGDPLRARALALLAMARRDNAQCCPEDAAVLVWLLGYTTEAEQLGKTLPPTSFANAFMQGSLSDSKWLTASERLRFVSLTEPPNIFRWPLNIQFAPLLMEVMSFPEQVPIARAEEALILNELETNRFNEGNLVFDGASDWLEANGARLTNIQRGAVIKRFEAALPARVASLKTRLLDAGAVRAYYESTFYAAVFKEFDFHVNLRSDREGARSFINWVGNPAEGTGSQVIEWMSDVIVAEYEGAKTLGRPAEALERLSRIGSRRKGKLLHVLADTIGANQPAIRSAAEQLYKRFDSRSEQIFAAGWMSMRIMSDPMRRDRYLAEAFRRSPDIGSYGETAWYRFAIGDHAALRALVDDRSAGANRASALNFLTQLGETDSTFIHRRFEDLIDQTSDMTVWTEYRLYLDRRGEAAIKERVMRRILAKRGDHLEPISKAWVVSALADALEKQGRYEEGFATVEPYIAVYSFPVLRAAMSLQQRLGRIAEANELGRALIERYPGAGSRAEYATILWREHKYEDAARLFNPREADYRSSGAMESLPTSFVETFAKSDNANAVAAYTALMAAGLDEQLLEAIPEKALDEKKPELAFALAERLASDPAHAPAAKRPESITAALLAYRALKITRGPDAAIAWLQPRVAAVAAMQAILVFYARREYDLVARYAPTVPETEKSASVAALQAASLMSMRVPLTDPRWQSLVNVIRGLPDPPNSLPMAKFLAGLVDETTLFAAAKSRELRTDAEYFAAVKALYNDDYERALPLIIAASLGPPNYPSQAWSLSQLYEWIADHASWETIVKEHR